MEIEMFNIHKINYILFAYIFLILLIASLLFWNEYRLVLLKPVVLKVQRGDHILQYDTSAITPEFLKNICNILEEYGEYFECTKDGVLIRNYLYKDMDLLQNYTNHAGYQQSNN